MYVYSLIKPADVAIEQYTIDVLRYRSYIIINTRSIHHPGAFLGPNLGYTPIEGGSGGPPLKKIVF